MNYRSQYALVLFWIVVNFCNNLRKYFCLESSIRSRNRCCKDLKPLRNWILFQFWQQALQVLSFSLNNDLIFPLNHGGSLSSQTITSWGMKLLRTFKTVLLKIKTFSSTCLFAKALSQSNSLTDRLMRSTWVIN